MRVELLLAFLVFFPFVAGLVTFFAGKKRDVSAIVSAVLAFLGVVCLAALFYGRSRVMLLSLYGDEAETALTLSLPGLCGFGLHFKADGFRLVYTFVAAFMWLMTTILSREYFKGHDHVNRFYLFLLWTLGATMGVFLSADLYTMFIFFELMSFTSYVWVAQEENRPSLRAAETYLAVAVTGGLVMLMGIFVLYRIAAACGLYTPGEPLYFETLKGFCRTVQAADTAGILGGSLSAAQWLRIAGCCMFFGFGAKAGAFPLHIWLPKAHPVAPAPASALLSGILTKTGIYGTLVLSCQLFLFDAAWGRLMLVIGVITMLGGALLAVFSVDLKRTLACSSMSQIGFILIGVGMQGLLGEEGAVAAYGTVLHMVNHSLIKLVLFMAAGVVFMNAHALDLNEIRGFGRKKPLLKGIFLVGALAIGGIPFFGGYVSKTLLHEAILEYGGGGLMKAVEWIFLFSGGLTAAYMTKLFVAVFVENNADRALQEKYDGMRRYMNGGSAFALTGSALLLLLWGLFPHGIMEKAAGLARGFLNAEPLYAVRYFSLENLSGGLISVGIGAAVYLLFIRKALLRRQAPSGKAAAQNSNEENNAAAVPGVYVNLWPEWLDLENMLYRPLLLTILPTVFGVLCRILDSFADTVVVLLRKTLYRDSPLPHERYEGNALTVFAGQLMNAIEALGNHSWNRKHPVHVDYVHLLAVKNEELQENNKVIGRSLSFGLLLFCVGLCLTLIYLIFW